MIRMTRVLQHAFFQRSRLFMFLITTLMLGVLPHDVAAEEFDRSKVTISQYVYKPYFTESGKGLAVDLWTAAYIAVGITPEVRMLPVQRAKQYLIDGTVDIFGGGGSTNFSVEEQEQYGIGHSIYFHFTLALAYYRPNLAPEDVERLDHFESLDKLRGLTFGSTAVYPGIPMLQNAGLRLVEYTLGDKDITYQQLQMLKGGRFETTQLTMLSAIAIIRERFPDRSADFGLTPPFVIGQGTRFYNTRNPKSVYFHQQCEKGMALIMQGGRESEYYRILESYWGKDNVPAYVLPDALKEFGLEQPDLQKALSYDRDENWKILHLEK